MATNFLSNWNWDPGIIIGTLCLAVTYAYFLTLESRSGPESLSVDDLSDVHSHDHGPIIFGRRSLCFWAGEIVLFLALVSPLDYVADHLSLLAHTVQHLLLLLVVPSLFLLAVPEWFFEPFREPNLLTQLVRAIARPAVALTVSILTLWIWHAPALYEAALNNPGIHAGEHLIFLVTALLFWWPVLRPSTHPSPLPELLQIVYLFVGAVNSTLLAALITFSTDVLYPTYAHTPLSLGLSPIADQQLAGSLMWIGPALWSLTVAVVIFFRWFDRPLRDDSAQSLEQQGATT